MTKILMVCLGNICRSPLAHGILESKLNLENFYVDSAGTAAYHVGEQPDPRSITIANSHGLDISDQSARQFKVEDFDCFDIIYAMDQSNYSNIIALARNNTDIGKVKLILEVNSSLSNKNVPDPYYGGDSGFSNVFNMLEDTCQIIAKELQS
ncbi:low molecular weight protein-tyrosine-phosphatase [Winogradskyella immobilis]|uniref:protein-tyrosine-phosphatase n=1 Tax=Winogradskyella immobilis TaxID=2816852 RepID=A0ABS8EPG2_9FLAO|nr:low molecular weight protein-tyrosine-phosphatase [Winogradskyella immobilis]MCC1484781.1 low molecular weight phosphotyrosine protein phosphatase [Winogradskyella immobilis]MCG0016873.1 low molecular weight phosphotyrosine protein phosphatase [Winogradskyella immobilis]